MPVPSAVPGWARTSSLAVSVLGLGATGYLTVEHYDQNAGLACPDTGTINCAKVTESSYGTFAGLPVALLGLLFFAGMTLLCLPVAWRLADRRLSLLRLGSLVLGLVFVLYLVWAELFAIGALCLWCTGVHVLTLALFTVVALGEALREPAPEPGPVQAPSPAGRVRR